MKTEKVIKLRKEIQNITNCWDGIEITFEDGSIEFLRGEKWKK